jgi:hypothetical protein
MLYTFCCAGSREGDAFSRGEGIVLYTCCCAGSREGDAC